jgi:hypothetical protein
VSDFVIRNSGFEFQESGFGFQESGLGVRNLGTSQTSPASEWVNEKILAATGGWWGSGNLHHTLAT